MRPLMTRRFKRQRHVLSHNLKWFFFSSLENEENIPAHVNIQSTPSFFVFLLFFCGIHAHRGQRKLWAPFLGDAHTNESTKLSDKCTLYFFCESPSTLISKLWNGFRADLLWALKQSEIMIIMRLTHWTLNLFGPFSSPGNPFCS